MKKYIGFLLLALLLTSCGKAEEKVEAPTQKLDFYLETEAIGVFGTGYTLEKSAKIESSSEVSMTSETSGRLSAILVKEGESVKKGQKLLYLSDSVLNLGSHYKQAELNVEQAKISYETNKINLDKSVFDAELNLEKLENNYQTLLASTEQDVLNAKNKLENSSFTSTGSRSSLDLEKLDYTIEKLKFDYETKLQANKEQLDSFILNLQNQKNFISNLILNTTTFGDELFGLQSYSTKPFDTYLGAKDSTEKRKSKDLLEDLLTFYNSDFTDLDINDIDKLESYISTLSEAFENTNKTLQSLKLTLNASIPSEGVFSQAQLDGFLSQVNAYISTYSSFESQFIAQKNSINSFLSTYKKNQESLQKQIELTKKDREILKKTLESGELSAQVGYEKTIISTTDSIKNMELQIKNAKNLLENAKALREVTLENLQNAIDNARLQLTKAAQEVAKLTVTAPVDGIIANITAKEGQIYNAGSPLLTLVTNSKSELVVFLTLDELNKIHIGDKVNVEYRGEQYNGEVYSKSTLADKNLNYKVKIILDKEINFLGGIANVSFFLHTDKPLIPINAIEVFGQGDEKKGEMNIYISGSIEQVVVELGETYGDKIEFTTDLDTSTKVILNNISNYDKDKFILKEKYN